MCLIGWRVDPGSRWPLLLAANRDERHDRPSAPAARWPGVEPDVGGGLLAGRDLLAGGTWLGVAWRHDTLRVGALTNIRAGQRPLPAATGIPSRGLLVAGFLAATDAPLAHLSALATGPIDAMAGFNLVGLRLQLADPGAAARIDLAALTHPGSAGVRALAAGTQAISNAGVGASWPKTRRLVAAIDAVVTGQARDAERPDAAFERLLRVLADARPADDADLPDTGVGLARERSLSPVFIRDDDYGTRCSTLLAVRDDGEAWFLERSYAAGGAPAGDVQDRFRIGR